MPKCCNLLSVIVYIYTMTDLKTIFISFSEVRFRFVHEINLISRENCSHRKEKFLESDPFLHPRQRWRNSKEISNRVACSPLSTTICRHSVRQIYHLNRFPGLEIFILSISTR